MDNFWSHLVLGPWGLALLPQSLGDYWMKNDLDLNYDCFQYYAQH